MCLILLVEDDHELRSAVVRALDEAGYSVVPSGTVAEAMTLIREHRFDLAIVDLKLPNGTGMDIVSVIHQHVPVVIITGYSSHEARNQASVYGVSAFIEKPFNEQMLLSAVMFALEDQQPPHRQLRAGDRQIGEPVDEQRLYSKLAALTARVDQLADRARERNGMIDRLASRVDAVMKRTEKCDERGIDIALLKKGAESSVRNWQLVVGFMLTLIQAGVTVFVVRTATTLADKIP